jgi:hypothetical protein
MRTVLRYAQWLISRDTSEGAPAEPLHEMQCTTCSERSAASSDVAAAQDWALQHSGRYPSHTGYRETVTRFWRTRLTDATPERDH